MSECLTGYVPYIPSIYYLNKEELNLKDEDLMNTVYSEEFNSDI